MWRGGRAVDMQSAGGEGSPYHTPCTVYPNSLLGGCLPFLSQAESVRQLYGAERSRSILPTAVNTILVIGASPHDVEPLRIAAEVRAIETALASAPLRDAFRVESETALRIDDIQRVLLQHRPQIVHFIGHGASDSHLILEDDDGNAFVAPADALTHLFELFAASIRCVVLFACYSEEQARSIAAHIPCVIGICAAVNAAAATRFATSFYQALAHGTSVKMAFDLACNQIGLVGLPEGVAPRLLVRRENDDAMILASPPLQSDERPGRVGQFSTSISGGQVGQVIDIDRLEGGLKIGKD